MSEDPSSEQSDRRWALLRDVLVFQVKLAADAVRDVVLVPISLGAALLDLISGTERDGLYFHQVIAAGRRSEGWINLFGNDTEPEGSVTSIDRVVERMEALVVEQYERGGMTAQAKDAIDRSLDRLTAPRGTPPGDEG